LETKLKPENIRQPFYKSKIFIIVSAFSIVGLIISYPFITKYAEQSSQKAIVEESLKATAIEVANNVKISANGAKIYLQNNPTENVLFSTQESNFDFVKETYDGEIEIVGSSKEYYITGLDNNSYTFMAPYIYSSIEDNTYSPKDKEYTSIYNKYQTLLNSTIESDVKNTVANINSFIEQNPETENVNGVRKENGEYVNAEGYGAEIVSTGVNEIKAFGSAKEFYVYGQNKYSAKYSEFSNKPKYYIYYSDINEYVHGFDENFFRDTLEETNQSSSKIIELECINKFTQLDETHQKDCVLRGFAETITTGK
jgi:hypothetical protein